MSGALPQRTRLDGILFPRMSPRIAIATCLRLPEPDPDQELLVEALAARGIQAELVPWDGPARDWAAFDLCLLRSTWNYPERPDDFRAWLATVEGATRVLNPAPRVRWNLHKGYLLELEAAGTPIVPTVLVGRAPAAELAPLLARTGWDAVVIKPAVSAASFRTRRFTGGERDAAARFLAESARARDTLVQPYLDAFAETGERALIWIDGEFTHAIEKRPRFAGEDERVSSALPLEPAEAEFAERLLAPLAQELLYARVDLVRGPSCELLLSELELVEPSLFLLQEPAALQRLVEGVVRRLR